MKARTESTPNALQHRYGASPRDVLDKIAPPRDIGIPIRDQRGARKIKQADLTGDLRIPRGGKHQVELVAAFRHYDGATGGVPGYYANVFLAWRHGTATWRSGGVRILAFEAERIARALDRGTGTQPSPTEPERISGGPEHTTSELRAKVVDDDTVLLFVVFEGQGARHYRSRGVEILAEERPVVAEGLRTFAKMRGRAK